MLFQDFKAFLKEYKVMSVAVAFVMGTAVNDLVKSFVTNIFMPLLNPLIPESTWREAKLSIGSVDLSWGAFVAQLLHFTILAFIVFLVVKKLIDRPKKEE